MDNNKKKNKMEMEIIGTNKDSICKYSLGFILVISCFFY